MRNKYKNTKVANFMQSQSYETTLIEKINVYCFNLILEVQLFYDGLEQVVSSRIKSSSFIVHTFPTFVYLLVNDVS